MTVKAQDIVDKVFLNIEDHDREHFKESEVLKEINSVRRELISSLNHPYTRTHKEPLVKGKTLYQFPSDLIRMTHMYLNKFSRTRLKEDYLGEDDPLSGDEQMVYRERVSSNEFELLPEPYIDALMSQGSGVLYENDLPDMGQVDDLWIDHEGVIHRCKTSYSTGTTELTLTSERLVPLQFLAVDVTAHIEVAIVNGGTTGTSSLSKIGSGTYASPYVYTFTLFDDDSSNDTIISLLSGDASLTAQGASATNVTVVPYANSKLLWTHEANWEEFYIEMTYKAELPEFFTLEDELHPSIVNPLRSGDALAYLTSAKLLTYMRRDPNTINAFRQEAFSIIEENQYQVNRRMGPVGFGAGYR